MSTSGFLGGFPIDRAGVPFHGCPYDLFACGHTGWLRHTLPITSACLRERSLLLERSSKSTIQNWLPVVIPIRMRPRRSPSPTLWLRCPMIQVTTSSPPPHAASCLQSYSVFSYGRSSDSFPRGPPAEWAQRGYGAVPPSPESTNASPIP